MIRTLNTFRYYVLSKLDVKDRNSKSFFFYKPIHPQREEEIMNQHKYTTEHWLTTNDIDLIPTCHAIFSNNDRNNN